MAVGFTFLFHTIHPSTHFTWWIFPVYDKYRVLGCKVRNCQTLSWFLVTCSNKNSTIFLRNSWISMCTEILDLVGTYYKLASVRLVFQTALIYKPLILLGLFPGKSTTENRWRLLSSRAVELNVSNQGKEIVICHINSKVIMVHSRLMENKNVLNLRFSRWHYVWFWIVVLKVIHRREDKFPKRHQNRHIQEFFSAEDAMNRFPSIYKLLTPRAFCFC